MSIIFKSLTVAAFVAISSAASALTITNVSYTDSSVTFTANGVVDGPAPSNHGSVFSIQYGGDIVSNPGVVGDSRNRWSGSLFDDRTLVSGVKTGIFADGGNAFSFSRFDLDLKGATATNNTVTVNFGAGFLNTLANNAIIKFVWGFGSETASTVSFQDAEAKALVIAAPVPLPAALPLLGVAMASLFGFGAMRRRKAA
ncbi:MAG: VPLPA-CTERM sorting domain-containing protein [Sulfitobacter sp.]